LIHGIEGGEQCGGEVREMGQKNACWAARVKGGEDLEIRNSEIGDLEIEGASGGDPVGG
jgi:hypothetical protein